MKNKLTDTEIANLKLNNAFYEEKNDKPDLDRFVNNNNTSLVLNSSKYNDKDNEDM